MHSVPSGHHLEHPAVAFLFWGFTVHQQVVDGHYSDLCPGKHEDCGDECNQEEVLLLGLVQVPT